MIPEESRYADDWFRIGEKDLVRVQRALEDGDPELAGFCLQQAVEKFLKGFLLSKGWKLRRIHDLKALLDDAAVYDPSLEEFRPACQRISRYYMLERYPLMIGGGPTLEEVRDALEAVRGLIERVKAGRS